MRSCWRANRCHRPSNDAAAGTVTLTGWEAARRYFPSLLRASSVTIVLSCLAMGLAVVLGVLIATGRVYGARPLRLLLIGYVELMRGTPLLLQLFVLYYGIAAAIQLPAFAAALLGLALNYAAYESEIYRSALEAVPVGQLEAGRTLGLSESQVLRLIRGPQAFRLALAPMTNDFIALLKDSSLVSVLTVLELTKQTQIFATNLGSWVIPGTLCAALYLAMSLPLAVVARRLERRLKAAHERLRRTRASHDPPVLRVSDVRLNRGERRVLDGVSLEADRGELMAIMGQSGSGKTTLLRAIAGLEPFTSGQIAVDDVTLESGSPSAQTRRALCRKVGMVFQFHCLFEHMSALDNVCLAPVHAYGVAAARCRTARARAAAGVWRGAPLGRASETAVRRRGAARRDRAGACRRPAGAAHGRADGVARSRAPRGARRADAQPHRRRAHAGRRHPR